jgi:hypothetical protein
MMMFQADPYHEEAAAPRGGPLKLEIPPDPPILDADALELPRHVQRVLQVLQYLKLQSYFDVLQNNGYDDVRSLYCLTESDMNEMGMEQRHAQRLLKWCASNHESGFNPEACTMHQHSPSSHQETASSAPPTPSEESAQWDYTSMARHFAITPGSPPTPSETFTHSPYTFFPYAVVSQNSPTTAADAAAARRMENTVTNGSATTSSHPPPRNNEGRT